MRAASLPSYHPGQLARPRPVAWYALALGLLLLGCAVLLAVGVLQAPAAEPELVAPFRWLRAHSLA